MRQAAVVSGVVSAVLFGGVLLALSSDYVRAAGLRARIGRL